MAFPPVFMIQTYVAFSQGLFERSQAQTSGQENRKNPSQRRTGNLLRLLESVCL
jgi:hypothetical protein